jgi:benzoate-CoA ligase family protein
MDLPSRFNIAEHLIQGQLDAGRSAKPYLYCGEERLTFGELASRARRCAHALRALGIEPEQRVLLVLQDGLDFPVCFFGAILSGAVAVPLNTQWSPGDYRHALADSRARALVVDAELWPKVSPATEGQRHLRHVLIAGNVPQDAPAASGVLPRSLADLVASAPDSPLAEPMTPDDPAFWLYTSGSTGAPKAAVHLHHDMLYPARHFARDFLGLNESDLTFSASKMFFAYGLGNSVYFPLATGGAAVVLRERPTPERIFDVLARHRPTAFYAVPTLFNALLGQLEQWRAKGGGPRPPPRLEHLRRVVSAGEPLPAEIFRRWRAAFGQDILDGIGSTEMLQTFLSNPPGAAREGTTGVVVPGYAARLVDEAGRDVPDGEAGVLWARGESSAPYYWNRRAKTRATMAGPWIVTGDRFRRGPDGYYRYEGRGDDMFKVGGNWVSPVEVENVLLGHSAVAECAVVGGVDAQGLIRAKAVVTARPGLSTDSGLEQDLIAHCATHLPAFKVPRWVEFREELPKTATGKIRRFLLGG